MSVFGCVNSHWSNDDNDRVLQVRQTLERLSEQKYAQQQPNILVGDLNAEIDYSIPDSALVILKDAGWVDVQREKFSDAENDPGYTLFYEREKRVDYIQANDQFYPAISSIKTVGKREHENKSDWWSDHYGLLITVNVDNFREISEVSNVPKMESIDGIPKQLLVHLQTQNATTDRAHGNIMLFTSTLENHPSSIIVLLILAVFGISFILMNVAKWLISCRCLQGSIRYIKIKITPHSTEA